MYIAISLQQHCACITRVRFVHFHSSELIFLAAYIHVNKFRSKVRLCPPAWRFPGLRGKPHVAGHLDGLLRRELHRHDAMPAMGSLADDIEDPEEVEVEAEAEEAASSLSSGLLNASAKVQADENAENTEMIHEDPPLEPVNVTLLEGPAGKPAVIFSGLTGPSGPPGERGPTGLQGVQGPPGSGGASVVGPTGKQGTPGQRGKVGKTGKVGAKGHAGSRGKPGAVDGVFRSVVQ